MVRRPVICDLGVRVRCVFKDADDLVFCGHPSSWCQVKPVRSDGGPGADESFQGRLIADDAHGGASRVSHDTTGEQDDVVEGRCESPYGYILGGV